MGIFSLTKCCKLRWTRNAEKKKKMSIRYEILIVELGGVGWEGARETERE